VATYIKEIFMESYLPFAAGLAIVFAIFELSHIHRRLQQSEAMLARLLDHFNIELGVLAEPSEKVKNLAIRPGSKIEAIKAYRKQTGVDVKQAKEVVERLASLGQREA
jgi:ribosomal protein L7/L12